MCAYMSGVGSRNQSPFTLLADRVPVHSSMWCCRKRSEEGQSLRDLVTYHGFITQEASLPFVSLEGGPLLYERELGGQKELGKALENYLSTLLHFHSSIPPLLLLSLLTYAHLVNRVRHFSEIRCITESPQWPVFCPSIISCSY